MHLFLNIIIHVNKNLIYYYYEIIFISVSTLKLQRIKKKNKYQDNKGPFLPTGKVYFDTKISKWPKIEFRLSASQPSTYCELSNGLLIVRIVSYVIKAIDMMYAAQYIEI